VRGLRRATLDDVPALTALQQAAYAVNREIMGVEPLPLRADYRDIVARLEAWLAEADGDLLGALILEPCADDLFIWNISVAPAAQRRGIGNEFLAAAERRAAALGKTVLRLRTGEKLVRNVAWYQRHGFSIERIEEQPDRRVVRMVKHLAAD
jgi:ribosomal protein S18 acetylase RimI-like enzyme